MTIFSARVQALPYFSINLPRHDTEKLMAEKTQKEWRRLIELDPKRVVVDGFEADVFGFDRHEFFALDRGLQLRIFVGMLVAGLFIARHSETRWGVEKR